MPSHQCRRQHLAERAASVYVVIAAEVIGTQTCTPLPGSFGSSCSLRALKQARLIRGNMPRLPQQSWRSIQHVGRIVGLHELDSPRQEPVGLVVRYSGDSDVPRVPCLWSPPRHDWDVAGDVAGDVRTSVVGGEMRFIDEVCNLFDVEILCDIEPIAASLRTCSGVKSLGAGRRSIGLS